MLRALAAGSGYVALAADAGAFAGDPESSRPWRGCCSARGLGFVELGAGALTGPGTPSICPMWSQVGPIEADPTDDAIDRALTGIEMAARRGGAVLAFARPTPLGLDRLAAWLETLPAKGLLLAPPSRLLQRAGGPQALAGE